MIRRITQIDPFSSERSRPAIEDKLDAQDALIALNNALWIGYKTLEYRDTKIVLKRQDSELSNAVHQTFTGTPKSMKKLVIAAKANKITRSAS